MNRERRITVYWIVLTLLVLFLAAVTTILLTNARRIRREHTERLQQTMEANFTRFSEGIQPAGDVEGLIWQGYELLWTMRTETEIPERVTAVDSLTYAEIETRDGMETGSIMFDLGRENMILAEFLTEDGERIRMPVFFRNDSTADAAELFDAVIGKGFCTITGYWDHDMFTLMELTQGDLRGALYQDPFGWPEGKTAVTYRVTGVSIRRMDKAWAEASAATSHKTAWTRANKLYSLLDTDLADSADRQIRARKDGLLQVVLEGNAVKEIPDSESGEPIRVRYVFGVEFSPLGIALREQSGALWLLLLLFAGGGALLLYWVNREADSERQGYQDEIARQAQALHYAQDAERSRREMTSAIAHELKTPISVLSSYAEALQEGIDPEKEQKYLSVIREETEKMDQMVMDLLDLSRLEAGKYKLQRENFDLEQLARQTLEPLEPAMAEKHLQLEWQVGEREVNADPGRIRQVLENFLTNAIRHTPEGGRIILRIGGANESFSVENQGDPIPAQQLDRVWETFWQADSARSEKGSGLGLAICRTIVQLHGGTCRAENTASGVRFSVSLGPDKRLYRLNLPKEEDIHLCVTIAQPYITVERFIARLGLMSKATLAQEIKRGNLKVGTDTVTDIGQKLYPGCVLLWREYTILVNRTGQEVHNVFLVDRLRPGSLGNMDIAGNGNITLGR